MKDETAGVAIKEFVRLKPKMYYFLVDDSSEHKKAKGLNKNVVSTTSHNEYRDVLLNKNRNRMEQDHRAETYEINKIFSSCLMIKYTSKTMDMMD